MTVEAMSQLWVESGLLALGFITHISLVGRGPESIGLQFHLDCMRICARYTPSPLISGTRASSSSISYHEKPWYTGRKKREEKGTCYAVLQSSSDTTFWS